MTESLTLHIPSSPLAEGAFAIDIDKTTLSSIFHYIKQQNSESFLVYGEKYWEFALVPKAANPIIRYARQLWTLFWQTFRFNNYNSSKEISFISMTESPSNETKGTDFFCQERAKSQHLYEGKKVDILYPDNPITKKHFLFVTKAHRPTFNEITFEEFEEVITLAKKVAGFYKGQKHFLFKTGLDAGQTVPHFHLHLMILESQTESFIGRLKIFANILFNTIPFLHTRLQGAALENRVAYFKNEASFANT